MCHGSTPSPPPPPLYQDHSHSNNTSLRLLFVGSTRAEHCRCNSGLQSPSWCFSNTPAGNSFSSATCVRIHGGKVFFRLDTPARQSLSLVNLLDANRLVRQRCPLSPSHLPDVPATSALSDSFRPRFYPQSRWLQPDSSGFDAFHCGEKGFARVLRPSSFSSSGPHQTMAHGCGKGSPPPDHCA